MRGRVKIVAIIITFIASLLVVLSPQAGGPIYEVGNHPEFSYKLVDNGDNDYIIIGFIHEGSGLFAVPMEIPIKQLAMIEEFRIAITPKDNLSNASIFSENLFFEKENLLLGENMRINMNTDVVKLGERYTVETYGLGDDGGEVVAEGG